MVAAKEASMNSKDRLIFKRTGWGYEIRRGRNQIGACVTDGLPCVPFTKAEARAWRKFGVYAA